MSAQNRERPARMTEKHLTYLDHLRESGITNMFGARPYLMNAFPKLEAKEAGEILTYWMYDDRHTRATPPDGARND